MKKILMSFAAVVIGALRVKMNEYTQYRKKSVDFTVNKSWHLATSSLAVVLRVSTCMAVFEIKIW